MIYKGYSNLKGCYLIKNKKINLSTVKNDNPIKNLLENFKSRISLKKVLRDDRKIIYQTTIQLFDILKSNKFFFLIFGFGKGFIKIKFLF